MGILKPNDVYQGRWTTITLDGEELAECYGNKAVTKINKDTIARCGPMMNASVVTSADNTGSIKLHMINARIQKKLLEGIKNGQMPTFAIVEIERNKTNGECLTKTYRGVSFDTLDWADWDATKVSGYEIAYTFDDASYD